MPSRHFRPEMLPARSAIAESLLDMQDRADTIVLAQASMARSDGSNCPLTCRRKCSQAGSAIDASANSCARNLDKAPGQREHRLEVRRFFLAMHD